jgi:hypothetical protein
MFKSDLAFGQKYEDIFIESVLKNPVGLERPAGKFSGYDLALNGERYEVKADRQTYKTGNFCIEVSCNDRPSGIATTQATRYIYFVVYPDGDYDIYNIPTSYILQLLMEQKYRRGMRGGDGGRSYFYLFSKNLFDEYNVRAQPVVSEEATLHGAEILQESDAS